jgi:hypothetical protein
MAMTGIGRSFQLTPNNPNQTIKQVMSHGVSLQ